MARTPCCDKNGLKKGPWTPEEDQKLVDYIHKHGYGNWRTLPKNAGLQRCGKSCRLRWTNYLRPDIKRGRFSLEEEEIIIQLHSILGNKWSAIATRLPGRTDNEIKNYWNTHIRKRLLRMGIDPVTHTPRLDLLDLSSLLTNSTLYNSTNPQMNLSRMLAGVDPDLLRLATSLISSHQQNRPTAALDHHHNNVNIAQTQFLDNQFHQNQLLQPQQNLPEFGGEWNSIEMGSNLTSNNQHHGPAPTNQYYYCSNNVNGSDQPVMDSSIFYSADNNFSGLATTPSSTYISSPTTLNSNSTTTTYVNEDEREIISYSCSDMLKFEIPDILDVSDFAANF